MKYFTGMVAVLTLFAFGCSRNDTPPEKTNKTMISGKWTAVKEVNIEIYKDPAMEPDTGIILFDVKSYVNFEKNGKVIFNLYKSGENTPLLYDSTSYKVSGNSIIIGQIGNSEKDTASIKTLTDATLVLYEESSPADWINIENRLYFER